MLETTESNSFKNLAAELETVHGLLSPGVRRGALRTWQLAIERRGDASKAVREVMPALLDAAEDASPPVQQPPSRRVKIMVGSPKAGDRVQAVALAEHAARLADQDLHLLGGGRAWRDFPIKLVATGTDSAGAWQDVEVEGPGGPARLRMRRDPILLEPPDERPRTPNIGPGSELGPLVMAARRVALVFNWSEADGLQFVMTGKAPSPEPLVARRLTGIAGQVGAAVVILAAAHVNPDSVKALFADERQVLLGRDKRQGGRDIDERSVELVRFVEASAADREPIDFELLRAAWNRRWKRTRPDWIYEYASWMRRDYTRTARSLLGRALKPARK